MTEDVEARLASLEARLEAEQLVTEQLILTMAAGEARVAEDFTAQLSLRLGPLQARKQGGLAAALFERVKRLQAIVP